MNDPFIRLLPETRRKIEANPNISFVETEEGGPLLISSRVRRLRCRLRRRGDGRGHAISQQLVRRRLLLQSGSLRGWNIDPQFQFDEVVGCFAVRWSVANDCTHALDVVTIAEMISPVP